MYREPQLIARTSCVTTTDASPLAQADPCVAPLLELLRQSDCSINVQLLRHRMRVLVIEDDQRLARQIARELRRCEHETTVCNDGGEGLQAALVQIPDLVVLDLRGRQDERGDEQVTTQVQPWRW